MQRASVGYGCVCILASLREMFGSNVAEGQRRAEGDTAARIIASYDAVQIIAGCIKAWDWVSILI
jgi:hypothetical protein